jgi:outer membrane autotransporter protein
VGIGGAWTGSRTSVAARGSRATGDTGTLIGYVSWRSGPITLDLGGDYGWSDTDVLRAVTSLGETETSNRDGTTGEVFAQASYDLELSGMALAPYLGLAHVSAETGAFAESGGLAALTGTAADISQTYMTLGVRSGLFGFHLGDMAAAPHLGVGWSHAFDAVTPGQMLTFSSTGSSFAVLGTPLGTDAATIDLGLDLAVTPQLLVSFGYDGNLSDRGQSHAVRGGLAWTF